MAHSDIALLKTNTAAPSAARLAAESAFSNVPTTRPPADGGPVVIVRRKKVVVDGNYDDSRHGGDAQIEAARPAKVFRVELDPLEAPEESTAAFGAVDCSRGDASLGHDSDLVVSRRQRHRRHGGVIIIRPAPPSASELAERTRMTKGQYERLRVELLELDRQIEAARQAEIDKAVLWIRKAIAEYDLSARDIGL